jgi:hypothetical protein
VEQVTSPKTWKGVGGVGGGGGDHSGDQVLQLIKVRFLVSQRMIQVLNLFVHNI